MRIKVWGRPTGQCRSGAWAGAGVGREASENLTARRHPTDVVLLSAGGAGVLSRSPPARKSPCAGTSRRTDSRLKPPSLCVSVWKLSVPLRYRVAWRRRELSDCGGRSAGSCPRGSAPSEASWTGTRATRLWGVRLRLRTPVRASVHRGA